MGHVQSSLMATSRIANANDDTGFLEFFALVSLFILVKAALDLGGDNFHVDKKKGRGIQKLGEILGRATVIGQNDLRSTNRDYEEKPAIGGPGRGNVQQHNKQDEEANAALQFPDVPHGVREEGNGPTATGIGYNILETTALPDLPAANVLCAAQERVELP